jgi:hypothetical protein
MSLSSLADPAIKRKYGVVERTEFVALEQRVKELESMVDDNHKQTFSELKQLYESKTYTSFL